MGEKSELSAENRFPISNRSHTFSQEVYWIISAKQVGIEALLDRTISSDKQDLSGGERQKIAMARAILKGGSVYLLDELEKNLDVESIQWLKEFMKKTEKTMVYVTHDERLV